MRVIEIWEEQKCLPKVAECKYYPVFAQLCSVSTWRSCLKVTFRCATFKSWCRVQLSQWILCGHGLAEPSTLPPSEAVLVGKTWYPALCGTDANFHSSQECLGRILEIWEVSEVRLVCGLVTGITNCHAVRGMKMTFVSKEFWKKRNSED